MKKIIAAVAVCLIVIFVFAGCNDPLASSNTSETKSSSAASSANSSKTSSSAKKVKTYDDSFSGLETYMKDKGFLTDDIIENANKKDDKTGKTRMELPDNIEGVDYKYGYEYIGAETGKKYINNNVIIELYAFKEGEQNDTIDSVKNKGTFVLFDAEIKAYLTPDDKYMLIYTDKNVKEGDTESDAYKTMQKTIKTFEAFSPTKQDDTKTSSSSESSEATSSKTSSETTSKTSE